MIFTDRIITVRKGESKINEPIIVYRGDYELEVRFTIMNSKFKFMSGTNLIESENAAYGQLAILTPYGGNIFSDIAKCNEGTVTFVLTKAMLDQIEEVGLYSFQIRLFDYNKESRVSIPPVEFGIEVREPITSEDHDNSVNNAIVGYSIAKIADALNEQVPDTFNSNGDYNKTIWETGDRITEGKLNKIEDAIDTINENEQADIMTLDKRITSNFNVLDSTKADKNEIFTMKNMGQDIKEAMTGGSVAVVGKDAILTENIVDEQVTSAKQSNITQQVFLEKGLDIDTVTQTVTIPYQRITMGAASRVVNETSISYKNDNDSFPYNSIRLYYNIDDNIFVLVGSANAVPSEKYSIVCHFLRGDEHNAFCNGALRVNGGNAILSRELSHINYTFRDNQRYPLIIGNTVDLTGVNMFAVSKTGRELAAYRYNEQADLTFTLENNQVLVWNVNTNTIYVTGNNTLRGAHDYVLLHYHEYGNYSGYLANLAIEHHQESSVVVVGKPKFKGAIVDISKVELYHVTPSGRATVGLVGRNLETSTFTMAHNQVLLWNLSTNSIVQQGNNTLRPHSYVLLAYYSTSQIGSDGSTYIPVIRNGLFAKYVDLSESSKFHSLVFSMKCPKISASNNNTLTIEFPSGMSMYALNKYGKEIAAMAPNTTITLNHNNVLLWNLYDNELVTQSNNTNRTQEYILLAYYNMYAKPDNIVEGELMRFAAYSVKEELSTELSAMNLRISNIEVINDEQERNSFLTKTKMGLVSHRGFHSHAPENSIKAISEAGKLGYEIVELDLQVTSDEELILMHDSTIDRTTNGSGEVRTYTLAALKRFKLDEEFSGYDPDDVYRIPTFDEACEEVRKYGMGVNVDCSKMTWTESIIHKAVGILKKHNIWENSFFVLSSQTQRDLLATLYPDVNVTWLSTDTDPSANIREVSKYLNGFITYHTSNITDELIQAYSDENIPIFIYGCNTLELVYKHKGKGIRFVETDYIPEGSEL